MVFTQQMFANILNISTVRWGLELMGAGVEGGASAMGALSMGTLFYDLVRHMDGRVVNNSLPLFVLYSGHDSVRALFLACAPGR